MKVVAAVTLLMYWLLSRKRNETMKPQGGISYSNPRKNHDNNKVMHPSRWSAEKEKKRLKRVGFEGSEKLNVYFNKELRGWFVGKSKW